MMSREWKNEGTEPPKWQRSQKGRAAEGVTLKVLDGVFRPASLRGDLSPVFFRVGMFGLEVSFKALPYDISLGMVRLGALGWDLFSLESVRIYVAVCAFPLWVFRLRCLVWELSSGICCLDHSHRRFGMGARLDNLPIEFFC